MNLILVPIVIILGAYFFYYYYSGELFYFLLSIPDFIQSYIPFPPSLPTSFR